MAPAYDPGFAHEHPLAAGESARTLRDPGSSGPSLTRGGSTLRWTGVPCRKVESGRRSRGERWPQSLLQSGARQRADNPVDFFPVPNHHKQRDRLCAKPRGESWIRVDVDLHDLQMPRMTFGEVFEHGRDHPTGPAPRRPEIHHDRHGRGRLGRERARVRVHDPRQRGLAPRTSQGTPSATGPTRLRALQVGQPMMVITTRVEPDPAAVDLAPRSPA